MDKTRTLVNICGKEYVMAGFESEEYIHRVAIYVDRKMTELKGEYVNLNENKLSVLTAVNVADDLLKLQDQFDAFSKEYEEQSEQIKQLKAEMSLQKDMRRKNLSAIKKPGSGQRFDGYK